MYDPMIELINERLARVEDKIDKLMAFRGYVLGSAAILGAIAGWLVDYLSK